MSTINEKISFIRENGMKVKEIAEKLDVSRQFLQQVRSGNRKMPADKMVVLDKLVKNLKKASNDNVELEVAAESAVKYVPCKSVLTRLDSLETDVALLKKLLAKGR